MPLCQKFRRRGRGRACGATPAWLRCALARGLFDPTGITLPSLGTWGGGIEAEDLPVANWFTAMNECDVAVALAAGGTEPAWQGGMEVTVDATPAQIIGELLKAANAQVAEVGGIWKVRVGGPGLPVYFVTDDDFVVTRPQELDPAPGYDKRYNAIAGRYYEPEQMWQPKDAPAITNATWEAQDGGQRFLASVEYLAVWGTTQVQRLKTASIAEERRFRRHQGVLPPDAAILEPLDSLQWTSTRNGYAAKSFEISQITDDPVRLLQGVSFRERDSADYVWTSGQERGVTIPSPVAIDPQAAAVPGWTMGAIELSDGVNARRPALRLAWMPAFGDAVTQLRYEIRLKEEGIAEDYATIAGSTASLILDSVAGIYAQDLYGWAAVPPGATFPSLILDTQYGRYGADETWASPQLSRIVLRGVISNLAAGEHFVTEGVLNGTDYEGSAFPVMDGPVVRSAWEGARTPEVFITDLDFEGGIGQLFIGAGISAPEIFTALPSVGNCNGRLVLLTTDYKLYRYTPSGWTTAVPIGDVTGQALATDVLIANSITGGLIAAAGIITGTAQINDAVITGAKIGDLQVDTLQIKGYAVTVPVRVTSNTRIDVDTAYVKLMNLSMNRAGYDTEFAIAVQISGSYSAEGSGILFELRRGATVVWSVTEVLDTVMEANFSSLCIDTDDGIGNTNHSLWAKIPSGYGTQAIGTKRKFLSAVQFKR